MLRCSLGGIKRLLRISVFIFRWSGIVSGQSLGTSRMCWRCGEPVEPGLWGAWKELLHSKLTVLLKYISGDMSESKAKKIEIKDVDGQTLRKLIDYIYTAEIEVTEENVQVSLLQPLPWKPKSEAGTSKAFGDEWSLRAAESKRLNLKRALSSLV